MPGIFTVGSIEDGQLSDNGVSAGLRGMVYCPALARGAPPAHRAGVVLAFYPTVPHKPISNVGTHGMFEGATARRLMVDGQVRTADVTDAALLDAMMTVPRERFVPPALAQVAYLDDDIPVGGGRALLKPMVLAKLIQAAGIGREDRVLDVGCATGYSSAILARVAGAVTALEENEELARQAKAALAQIDATGVQIVVGPLTAGWPAAAPYDAILLNGATEIVPEGLGRQLKPEGRLTGIDRRSRAGKGTIYRVVEGVLVGRPIFDASAPLLPGFAATPSFAF